MDITIIENLLSSVGFPIICCYFMYRYIGTKDKQIDFITENHKEEVTAMTDALNKNTEVMDRILELLRERRILDENE